jgi:glucosamine-6-phosphate deaminase
VTFRVEALPEQDWAATVASLLSSLITPESRLCLATGGTVAPVYSLIDDLNGATIFLLDEFGGLPRDDPGRCVAMIRRDLLAHTSGNGSIFVPDVDADDPEAEALRYGRQIVEGDGIDLAVVGLGRNGHIGMNEPGSTPDLSTRVVDLAELTSAHTAAYGATTSPTWGITVGMAELMAARELWLLVTGGHKREILRQTLSMPIGPDVPATYLRRHENCTVFADRPALGER